MYWIEKEKDGVRLFTGSRRFDNARHEIELRNLKASLF